MNRIKPIIFFLLISSICYSQDKFSSHLFAKKEANALVSVGFPFNSSSGLAGHFLPEIRPADSDIEFKIYPNPVINELRVETNATFQVLNIFDSKRSLVYTSTSVSNDLQELAVGAYTIEIICEESTYYQSIIKVK